MIVYLSYIIRKLEMCKSDYLFFFFSKEITYVIYFDTIIIFKTIASICWLVSMSKYYSVRYVVSCYRLFEVQTCL